MIEFREKPPQLSPLLTQLTKGPMTKNGIPPIEMVMNPKYFPFVNATQHGIGPSTAAVIRLSNVSITINLVFR